LSLWISTILMQRKVAKADYQARMDMAVLFIPISQNPKK
jgi:hypothetical protein